METILPLVIIGLGGSALLILRAGPLVLGGLLVQWVGLVLVALFMGGGVSLGAVAAEAITALACISILALTMSSLSLARLPRADRRGADVASGLRSGQASTLPSSAEDLWPFVVAVAAAIAGLVLARLYPLGGSQGLMVAFYWTVLVGLLVLVLEGARDAVKLAAGLLALLNAVALLLNTLPGGDADPVALGLMAACRIALSAIVAYAWLLIHTTFSELSLSSVFTARDPALSAGPVEEAEAVSAEPSEEVIPAGDVEAVAESDNGGAPRDDTSVEGEQADEERLKRITPGT